ncbi:hypothetical protein F2Q69_00018575 [Brassica cretica]|uniref:VQ domain-containing protein n=1 Tax=Brassica cretica TaxID=69181 RepID=A0A8S9Q077_BRACR|nr:hypothetical protein F2Q69_00018575 [Brassica cretica]
MNNKGSQNFTTCKPVTTFVQTDTNSFREIVQRLTGPSENNKAAAVPEATVIKLEIVKPPLSFKHTGTTPSSKSGITTPSSLFSDLSLTEGDKADIDQEEKAIKERRFYLHPSPRSKPRYTEPELLTLFPLTSPISSGRP